MKEYTVKVDNSGTKYWYLNGKLHREDGPAVEWSDGTEEWWINGKRHREDGPAIEWTDGEKSWWINDKKLTEQEHREQTSGKTVMIDGVEYRLVKK